MPDFFSGCKCAMPGSRQPLVLFPAELSVFPLQDAPCRRSVQPLVCPVDFGQQSHIGVGVACGEPPPRPFRSTDLAVCLLLPDQPSHLWQTAPRQFAEICPDCPTLLFALPEILLPDQRLLHDSINFARLWPSNPMARLPLKNSPICTSVSAFRRRMPTPPIVPFESFSGSSCTGNESGFRIILYWTILSREPARSRL